VTEQPLFSILDLAEAHSPTLVRDRIGEDRWPAPAPLSRAGGMVATGRPMPE
jgi:hypothetical protein